jgi:hypothetical protein
LVLKLVVRWMREDVDVSVGPALTDYSDMMCHSKEISNDNNAVAITGTLVKHLDEKCMMTKTYPMLGINVISRVFLDFDEWRFNMICCNNRRFRSTIKHQLKIYKKNFRKDLRSIKNVRNHRDACESFKHALAVEKQVKRSVISFNVKVWDLYWCNGRCDPILGSR